MKYKAKNEKVKSQYFKHLREAEGYSEKTLEVVEKSIWKYEEFSKEDDYALFTDKVAGQFKKWLSKQTKRTGGSLSLAYQYHLLRHVRAFFLWLSGQPGYKSRISAYDAQYLKLDKKQSRIATSTKPREYPTLEYTIKLCKTIPTKTEMDQRDRALIAFHFLSAMRVSAIFSLPLGCFNVDNLEVNQDPKQGVLTKNGKRIMTKLFNFDNVLLSYVREWVDYLQKVKCYGNSAPLFPRTKLEQNGDFDLCFKGKEVTPEFWQAEGAILTIFKTRMTNAELTYYSPHTFRHGAIAFARKFCRTEEQRKAISQNVGHEHVGTTFSYGNMDEYRVSDVIGQMHFQVQDKTSYNLENIPTDVLFKEMQARTTK